MKDESVRIDPSGFSCLANVHPEPLHHRTCREPAVTMCPWALCRTHAEKRLEEVETLAEAMRADLRGDPIPEDGDES